MFLTRSVVTYISTVCLVGCVAEGSSSGRFSDVPLAVEEILRAGSIDDEATALTFFRALEVAPDGRIYTLHRQENVIRVHRSDGTPLGTIGRQGKGPGEFSGLLSMGIHGDTLWVFDLGTNRFSFFDLDGKFLRSLLVPFSLGTSPGDNPPGPIGFFDDGSINAISMTPSRLVASGAVTEHSTFRMDSTGKTTDTLTVSSYINTQWAVSDPSDRWASYQRQPYTDTEIALVSQYQDRVVRVTRRVVDAGLQSKFTVTALDFAGDTIYSREFAYDPVPFDDAVIDSLVDLFAAGVSRRPGRPTAARAAVMARASLYLPAHHPPVSQLLAGSDGSVWLKGPVTGATTNEWMVLAPDGTPVGRAALPVGFRALWVDLTTAWGMELDDLDVPYIVGYRIKG